MSYRRFKPNVLNDEKYKDKVIEVDTEREIRCPNCNRLLCKGNIDKIEIKCPRCGEITSIEQL